MALKVARTIEYGTVSVVVLLGLSGLVSACSSSLPASDTTGSITKTHVGNSSGIRLPPSIHAPPTMPASRTASFAPVQKPRQQICHCDPNARHDNRDITASIPPSRAGYQVPTRGDSRHYVVHTIAPSETLYSISRRYRIKVADVAAVNRIKADSKLRFGELLVIPSPGR